MSTSLNMTDQDRVLTLLHMLDDDVAERALRSLDPDVAGQLRDMLNDFSGRAPSPKEQRRVLDEFDRFFNFAKKYAGDPALKLHTPPTKKERNAAAAFALTGEAIEDLENMNVHQVTAALEEETPRTAAILMKELTAERNAGILSLMKPDFRDSVVRELSLNPKAPPILVQQVARSTAERAVSLPAERPEEPDPVQRIAEVLRATDKKQRKSMIKALQEQDEEISARIQKLLYRFEDIVGLDDRQVRAVLSKVETSSVSTAMFGADEAITEKIMSNLSKRARATLEEELSFLSHVPEQQLILAREAVGEAIGEVEMEAD
ncbi:MAG: FliG C-terminal domain-containing protein [Planctomycetaceae bacterium]